MLKKYILILKSTLLVSIKLHLSCTILLVMVIYYRKEFDSIINNRNSVSNVRAYTRGRNYFHKQEALCFVICIIIMAAKKPY